MFSACCVCVFCVHDACDLLPQRQAAAAWSERVTGGPSGVQGGLRVTEQGEMVHSKFGSPDIAQVTMESFTTAVIEARLLPPSPPKDESWRDIMEELSSISCEAYRRAPPPPSPAPRPRSCFFLSVCGLPVDLASPSVIVRQSGCSRSWSW